MTKNLFGPTLLLGACLLLVPTMSAFGVTFTVNSTADAVDMTAGDGICETSLAGECTLRAAIQEANALLGADVIRLPAGEYILRISGFGAAEVGDLDLTDDLSIAGQSKDATIVDGNNMDDGVFEIHSSVSADMGRLTIQNCDCLFGGIRNGGALVLYEAVVSGNRRGVSSLVRASAAISNTTISNNNPRGGISNLGEMSIENSTIQHNIDDWEGFGGGIKNAVGSMTIEGTTISGNYARWGGGGIHNQGELSISNTTISGNRADDVERTGRGGAIYNIAFAPMLLNNVTIANNESTRSSAIFISATNMRAKLSNTIVANNTGSENCEIYGRLTSLGHNLSDDSTCNFTSIGDLTDTDPRIGPLQNNGGMTDTHELLSDSPAIDAGSLNCPPPTTDQRGYGRPVDGDGDSVIVCDIGAFEFGALPPTIPIAIDIKPGGDPNAINPGNQGVIPVAVLGSVDFDAMQIDTSTVAFGPGEALPIHHGHMADVNGDGLIDSIFHFATQEVALGCGDTDVTLSGETFAGQAITGTDSVKTVGCR